MAYVISDECIMCGACADECPCSAISEGDAADCQPRTARFFLAVFYYTCPKKDNVV